ncbi:MAG: hypothetical protein ACREJC_01635 [Tepidisphaeraceae bacterium]
MSKPLLHPDLSAGVHELRGALTDLLGDVGADVRRPQELARRLSLDKSLAWKLSRIVSAGDPQDALQYLPGDAALAIVVRAVQDAGGSKSLRRRAEGAISRFREAVLQHLGDRSTLDLVVDGMPTEGGERLLASRKLAFRGNSGIWGVQAKARFSTIFLAPNPDRHEMIDTVLVSGWVDFRRLREDARWVLFRLQSFTTHGEIPRDEPVDPLADPAGPMLMADFCSASLPEIHASHESGTTVHELGNSTIGNSGSFTCVFGSISRAIGSRYAKADTDEGVFRTHVSAPVENLQFDMLVHRDCAFALNQTVRTVGALSIEPTELMDRDTLPIHVSRAELGREPPVVQSGLYARYGELTDRVFSRMGWDRREFVGLRYEITYPPFPSTVVVSFPLERQS